MFLKVEIDGKEDFYSFKGKEVVRIGRSPVSDIQIINDGVSRNHIEIRNEGGDFYVYDRGSTNGTFINDEELEIDEKYPFNTFFPVKLGFDVFIYMMDEVSVSQLEKMSENSKKRESKTLADLGNTSISSMARLKNSSKPAKVSKRKKVRQKEQSADQKTFRVKILIAIIAVALFFYEDILTAVSPGEVTPVAKKKVESKSIEEKRPVKPKDSPSKKFMPIVTSDKCLSPNLKILCDTFKKVKNRNYYEGLVEKDDTLYIVLDPKSSIEHFKKVVPKYSEKEREFVLLRLARNPKFQSTIMPTGRFDKNTKVDVYSLKLNEISEYSDHYYQLAMNLELLFSPLGKKLREYNGKKISFIFYKIINNEYRYKSIKELDQSIFDLSSDKLKLYQRGIKFALFNGENDIFVKNRKTKKRKYRR